MKCSKRTGFVKRVLGQKATVNPFMHSFRASIDITCVCFRYCVLGMECKTCLGRQEKTYNFINNNSNHNYNK